MIVEPVFLPNKGQVLDVPEQFLQKQFSPHSRNMEFTNELIQGRLGLEKFNATTLTDPVLLIDQFWKFDNTWQLMVCTTKDIMAWDFDNTRGDYKNKLYQTGTITIAAGSLDIVTGTGTSWSSELSAGDYIKIDTGNVHSGSTWYEIQSVDSDIQLTLTTNAVEVTDSPYVARIIFTGDSTNFWSVVTFIDENLGETWIATNGKDTPVRYTGSGQVQDLANLPTGFTTAKYVDTYKDRVIFAWTVEGGQNQPIRLRWSDVANCESWTDRYFQDFVEGQLWITGLAIFGDYIVVMRERDAYIGRWVGGYYVFDFEISTTPVGCYSANSIIVSGDFIYYYGIDNKFHRWNLLREEDIGVDILPYLKEFDPNMEGYIYGWEVEWKNQIRWMVPYGDVDYNNAVIVYDYEYDVLQIWEYSQSQALCCIGEYLNEADMYVDDSVWGEYYVDEQVGYWDDRMFLSNAPIILYGGYDGYIRKVDFTTQDDGSDYTRTLRFKRLDFRLPHQQKRLWKQQYWFEAETAGAVTAKMKKDDSNNYEVDTHSISLANTNRDIIKENIRWNKQAENFQPELTATNHFSLLGFLNFLHPKRKNI